MVRFVRHYWALKGKPYRTHFIARRRGYHGSTMVSASLGGMDPMHGQGGLPLPGFHHVLQPNWYEFGGDLTPEEFGLAAAGELEKKILEVGPDNVAAFVGEPIQGAGGVIIPPPSYWPAVERICRKYGILIVADEVICGFGRTGRWWGFETMGFNPDIVVMAKGLSSGYQPIGAMAVADHLIAEFFDKGGEFFHGYTYSGHPVACAVALENIRIMQDEGIVERGRASCGLSRSRPCRAQRSSAGRGSALDRPDRRDRARPRQGDPPALRADQPGRAPLPRPLLPQRPHHACLLGHDGVRPAADHRPGGDRREWMVLARRALDLTLEDVSRG